MPTIVTLVIDSEDAFTVDVFANRADALAAGRKAFPAEDHDEYDENSDGNHHFLVGAAVVNIAEHDVTTLVAGSHVLVTGTPAEGFTFVGPVTPNDPDLEHYTDIDPKPDYWWYADLAPLPTRS